MNVPIAANVLGTIGAICWSVQVLSSRNFTMPQQDNNITSAADTPNCHQLPPPSYHRLTALNDASLGLRRSTIRGLQYHRELQRRTTDTSSDLDVSKLTDMEPMLLLREELESCKVCGRSGRDVHSDGRNRSYSDICLEGGN